jgi:hypothetical protein
VDTEYNEIVTVVMAFNFSVSFEAGRVQTSLWILLSLSKINNSYSLNLVGKQQAEIKELYFNWVLHFVYLCPLKYKINVSKITINFILKKR